MNKRGMLFLLGSMFLGALGVAAAPWGAMSDYVDVQAPEKTGNKYLLRKILDGQTISVGLKENSYTERNYEKLSRLVEDSYKAWFSNAVRYIEKAEREEEFADILPILRRGVQVQINKTYEYYKAMSLNPVERRKFLGEYNDVNIIFLPFKYIHQICGKETGGCYVHGGDVPVPEIYLPTNDGLLKILTFGGISKERFTLHEIGHSIGFSDQYLRARSRNSDAMYSVAEERETVMRYSRRLTCDDADGMINLIDITQGKRRGGEVGWKTLCPKSQEYYIGGISAGKGPYRLMLNDGNESVVLTTYEKGKVIASEVYPFAKPEGSVPWQETPVKNIIKKDRLERPLLAEGPNGETIYYSYLYDRTERLTVQNGLALSLVTQVRYNVQQPPGNMKEYKEMFFGQRGVICFVKAYTLVKRGYISEYREGVGVDDTSNLYVKRSYNAHGKLIENEYKEYNVPESRTGISTQKGTPPDSSRRRQERLETRLNQLEIVSEQAVVVNQLDQWTQQTLQEFSRKKK